MGISETLREWVRNYATPQPTPRETPITMTIDLSEPIEKLRPQFKLAAEIVSARNVVELIWRQHWADGEEERGEPT